MPAATDTRYWTPDDVWALPDDGNRYECIDGVLLVTPSPQPPHQFVLGALSPRLYAYVRAERLGRVLTSPADLRLESSNVVQPDLFVVAQAPGAAVMRVWREVTSLLLAVEVLSPSTARYDRGLKRRYYQRANVAEYWIVDSEARLIERWRRGEQRPEVVADVLTWHPEGAAAAMELDVAALFEEALGA
ncbi:MAG: Uma2 family endonuclease [Gemmatimonadaceae bacterium]|nr:Uma2 family endonuclease [Gemmatimonadaceae bacterium]